MKTSELTGPALDWAVAKCEGEEVSLIKGQLETRWTDNGWKPSTDWAQGGPLIERESIALHPSEDGSRWTGVLRNSYSLSLTYGHTPLIAAMRCFVASHLGDEVDIPEELL